MAKAAGFTLGELARTLRATLEGDPAAVVTGVAPLESAGPGQISFLVDPRFAEAARASGAGAFLAGPDVSGLPGRARRWARRRSCTRAWRCARGSRSASASWFTRAR